MLHLSFYLLRVAHSIALSRYVRSSRVTSMFGCPVGSLFRGVCGAIKFLWGHVNALILHSGTREHQKSFRDDTSVERRVKLNGASSSHNIRMSWAASRPSSGDGFVPVSRKKVRSSSGGSPALGVSFERTRPKTSVERVANAVVEGVKEPPSPPRRFPSTADVDTLEQAFIASIRAAGLKLGR